MARIRIRNEWMEQHLFRVRAIVAGVIAVILLLFVAGRLIDLQLVNYSHYATLAEGNRLHDESVTPPRDRKSVV